MIIAFMPDLIMRSKLDVACRHYEVPVQYFSTLPDFENIDKSGLHTLFIDLDANPAMSLEIIEKSVSLDIRTVAFCSHVLTDLMEKARQAGAKMVYSNSNMTASLPGMVSEIAFMRDQSNKSQTEKT